MDHTSINFVNTNWIFLVFITLFFTISVMLIYYRLDEYDPEPPSQVFEAFAYGFIVPVFTVPLFYGFNFIITGIYDPLSQYFIELAVFTPIIEEIFKTYVLLRFVEQYRLDGPMDGLIYGIAVGSGFATIENLIYGFSTLFTVGLQSAIQLSLFRGGFAFVGHPIYTAIVGYAIGASKVGMDESIPKSLLYAILYHILWNATIIVSSIMGTPPIIQALLILIVITITLVHLLIRLRIARKIELILAEQGYYDSEDRSGYSVNFR